MRNPTKIDENSIKNPSKIYQKSMKMRSMGASWDDFGGIWAHDGWKWWVLAPFWSDFFHFFAPRWLQDAFKMGSWAVLGSKLGPKIGQNRSQERSEMWSIFWWIWRSIFEAIWSHLGSQTPPKMKPSWLQNRCKLGCWFESCFVMDFGWIFIDFLLQHSMAEVAKIVDSSTFFIDFWYFGYWALGLILGLIFDGFWGDFGVENRWKIDKKSIKKQIKNKMRFGIDFWWLLGGFWGGFGGQVGAKLGPKSIKNRSWKKHATKMVIGNY